MKLGFKPRLGRRAVIALVSVIIVTASVTAFYFYSTYVLPTGISRSFTIVVDSRTGYNGSLHHTLPFPEMTSHKGDNIIMRLVNNDMTKPLGWP